MSQLTQRHIDIIQALYERNIPLANGGEDDRRKLTRMIAEQICLEFGPKWGVKSTTPNHPQSKDTIVEQNDNGSLNIWDWQNGTTRKPQLRAGQPPDHVEFHHFIEVSPVNHLQVPSNGDNQNPPVEDNEVKELLHNVLKNQQTMLENQATMIGYFEYIRRSIEDVKIPEYPVYEGSILGFKVTLAPKK